MSAPGAGADKPPGYLRRMGADLRRYFITGILVLAPVVITFWVLYNVFNILEGRFAGLFAAWGRYIPGLGFIAGVVIITAVGWVASQYIGRRLIGWVESLVARIPVVSRIYRAAQQVGEAVLGRNRSLFQAVVLVEYPRADMWCLAFMTHDESGELEEKTGRDLIAVFLPTTPNPTSGYLLYVPREDLIFLRMGVEEAMKLIISAGAFVPGEQPVAAGQLELPVGTDLPAT